MMEKPQSASDEIVWVGARFHWECQWNDQPDSCEGRSGCSDGSAVQTGEGENRGNDRCRWQVGYLHQTLKGIIILKIINQNLKKKKDLYRFLYEQHSSLHTEWRASSYRVLGDSSWSRHPTPSDDMEDVGDLDQSWAHLETKSS